jgi:hypothetical protein
VDTDLEYAMRLYSESQERQQEHQKEYQTISLECLREANVTKKQRARAQQNVAAAKACEATAKADAARV